jgi:formyltetrahydrofolate synthetase
MDTIHYPDSNQDPQPIGTIATDLGLAADQIETYGNFKAKLALDV